MKIVNIARINWRVKYMDFGLYELLSCIDDIDVVVRVAGSEVQAYFSFDKSEDGYFISRPIDNSEVGDPIPNLPESHKKVYGRVSGIVDVFIWQIRCGQLKLEEISS